MENIQISFNQNNTSSVCHSNETIKIDISQIDAYLVSEISLFDFKTIKFAALFFFLFFKNLRFAYVKVAVIPVLKDRWHQLPAHIFEQRYRGGGSTWTLAQLRTFLTAVMTDGVVFGKPLFLHCSYYSLDPRGVQRIIGG